jgi:hypothetical protein
MLLQKLGCLTEMTTGFMARHCLQEGSARELWAEHLPDTETMAEHELIEAIRAASVDVRFALSPNVCHHFLHRNQVSPVSTPLVELCLWSTLQDLLAELALIKSPEVMSGIEAAIYHNWLSQTDFAVLEQIAGLPGSAAGDQSGGITDVHVAAPKTPTA